MHKYYAATRVKYRYRVPVTDNTTSGIGTHVISKKKICNPKLTLVSSTCTVCPQFRRCTGGQRFAQKETGLRNHPRKAPRDQPKTEEREGISFLVPEQNAGQNLSIEWVRTRHGVVGCSI